MYSREPLYLVLKLRGCHAVKFPTMGDVLILALSLTAFEGVTLLIKTPFRLWLAHPPCTLQRHTGETNHFFAKVPPMYSVFSFILSLAFSHCRDAL